MYVHNYGNYSSSGISDVTLHVQIVEQMKSRYVAATKRENDCFNNDHKKKRSISRKLKSTSYDDDSWVFDVHVTIEQINFLLLRQKLKLKI